MLDCICFDFDGTLVNSMEVAFDAFVRVGPEFGCKPFTREQLLDLRGLHVREVIRAVGVPLYRVPQLARRMRRMMRAGLMDTPPVEGIGEVLEVLARRGYRLVVLSSNAENSVRDYLARHDLNGFERVIGDTGLFSKSKALRELAHGMRIAPERLLYVGDEIRDIEAAHRAGVRSAAVGWGYNTLERLADLRPDLRLDRPRDLLDVLETRTGGERT
ncbi:HAD-IA family hydrolase [Thiocystis violacea]|uniref:HAD-IA family hydrolase n=1 Tax=Thiocystis violacea TaxID=13725 RepID=UPI001908C0F5|nr:haloacid dehalogenase [Thiocystis violacea]